MIRSIEINNFKGIKKFKETNLNRVNIFVGGNNSSKTSLIEGIYIGLKDNYMGAIETIQKRNLAPMAKTMETLFHELDTSQEIEIKLKGEDTNVNINTTLNLLTEKNKFTLPTNFPPNITIQNQEEKNYILKQKSGINKNIVNVAYKFGFVNNSNGQRDPIINIDISNPKNKNLISPKNSTVAYIAPKLQLDPEFINELREQIKSKVIKEKILKELRIFDSKIEDIIIDGMIIEVYLKNVDRPMPLQAMGAGSSTILELSSIFGNDNITTILIDEIETGLHIESMKNIANYITKIMKERKNLQLFITSHSVEIIKLLAKKMHNDKIISAFRLTNTLKSNSIKGPETVLETIEYSTDLLDTLDEGWEIR